jgi:quinol monooxygenase YgiN
MQRSPGDAGFARLEHTRDHDNPNHFLTIVEFPSFEAAMANNSRPETDEMARQLAALCTSGPHYTNLDVELSVP